MNNIQLVIAREYLSRVRKKSFLIMTLLGPILMSALFIVPALISQVDNDDQRIVVVDQSGLFLDAFPKKSDLKLKFIQPTSLQEAKAEYKTEGGDGLLYIPESDEGSLTFTEGAIEFYSENSLSINSKTFLERSMEKRLEKLKLRELGINPELIESAKTNISINTLVVSEDGTQKSFSEMNTALGLISGTLIYLFIFIYGAMVMRGVIEEKSNRIVEVIISSVKPFQLMLGKIIGVAATGLTQFLLWVVLTFIIITVAQTTLLPAEYDPSAIAAGVDVAQYGGNAGFAKVMEVISSINFPLVIGSFIFYFLGGYLLYSAFFAAIGAAVDNESDTQQFMLPVTVPLILSFMVATRVAENPNGAMGFWFSIIPLTSPIVMMVRIPFGVPAWELILSMVILAIGFIGTTWIASRIYRVGILMYGKKVSWKELFKWFKYKA